MLLNSHVQILMGIVGVANENRKSKGKKFLSTEELLLVEKKIISCVNKYNRFENFIVNNKVSIFIKELFYLLFGVPYPEFLFNDEENDYITFYQKGKTEDGNTVVEFRTSPDVRYAVNVSKFWFGKKYYMKYAVNKTSKMYGRNGSYRFKRILTYT